MVTSKKEIIKSIIFKFKDALDRYDNHPHQRSLMYSMFAKYMTLTEFNIFPEEAFKYLEKMIFLHFGLEYNKIKELFEVQAKDNMHNIKNPENLSKSILTVEEKKNPIFFSKYDV